MSLSSWWAGRHERRRENRVLNDLAQWYLDRSDDHDGRQAYADARRDLRLQRLGVPETFLESNAEPAKSEVNRHE